MSSHTRLVAAAAGLAAVALTAGIGRADAASSKPVLQVDAFGSYVLQANGDAVVTGPGTLYTHNGKKAEDVQVTATLSADDGTLPTGEDCESASATFSITNDEGTVLTLSGPGEVCASFPQPPTSIVTHVFTGRYVVEDGWKKALDTDGFFEVRLGTGNVGSAFAIDT